MHVLFTLLPVLRAANALLRWDNIAGIDRMPGKINKYRRKDTMEMDWESYGTWMDGVRALTMKIRPVRGNMNFSFKDQKNEEGPCMDGRQGFALMSGDSL